MDPMWLQWSFAVACLTVGGYYAAALIARRGGRRESTRMLTDVGHDLSHLLMALGMAAMFSPIGAPVPRLVWVAAFGLSAAWFASSALRAGLTHEGWDADSTAHHLVANLAMLFMLMSPSHHAATGAAGGPGHEGHTGAAAGAGWLTAALGTGPIGTGLVVLLAGYFAWHTLRALRRVFGTGSAAQPEPAGTGSVAVVTRSGPTTSRLAAAGHVVMGTAMTVMFGLML